MPDLMRLMDWDGRFYAANTHARLFFISHVPMKMHCTIHQESRGPSCWNKWSLECTRRLCSYMTGGNCCPLSYLFRAHSSIEPLLVFSVSERAGLDGSCF
jgi:hypothetical protein